MIIIYILSSFSVRELHFLMLQNSLAAHFRRKIIGSKNSIISRIGTHAITTSEQAPRGARAKSANYILVRLWTIVSASLAALGAICLVSRTSQMRFVSALRSSARQLG